MTCYFINARFVKDLFILVQLNLDLDIHNSMYVKYKTKPASQFVWFLSIVIFAMNDGNVFMS